MSVLNYEELTLESDTFEQARENFNMLFQRLLKKMEQTGSDEGSITLKVDVETVTDWIPDGEGGSKEIHKPILKHKVTTAVPVKDSFDGKKDTGMNLVYDEELRRYVLKYVSVGGQRSIFDEDFQENISAAEVVDEGHMLPGPSNALPLPEEMDCEEYEDYEYEEPEED